MEDDRADVNPDSIPELEMIYAGDYMFRVYFEFETLILCFFVFDFDVVNFFRHGIDEGEVREVAIRRGYVRWRKRCFLGFGIVECHHESSR